MGATRDVPLIGLPIRGISVNTLAGATAAITVVPSDSGVMFVNKYTSATTYTLPAVADGKGKCFIFYNSQTSAAIKLAISTAAIIGGDTTNKVATSDAVTGSCAMVIGDGSYYYLFVIAGTWTVGAS
jgi:hypothetical protein